MVSVLIAGRTDVHRQLGSISSEIHISYACALGAQPCERDVMLLLIHCVQMDADGCRWMSKPTCERDTAIMEDSATMNG